MLCMANPTASARFLGEVLERSNRSVLKTDVVLCATVGSNPTLTASCVCFWGGIFVNNIV